MSDDYKKVIDMNQKIEDLLVKVVKPLAEQTLLQHLHNFDHEEIKEEKENLNKVLTSIEKLESFIFQKVRILGNKEGVRIIQQELFQISKMLENLEKDDFEEIIKHADELIIECEELKQNITSQALKQKYKKTG